MTKQRYIFFSIVTNILLTKIVLSASKHLVTASGMGWFPYEGNLHLVLPLLMPLLSLFGAVMTIQKRRKTGFDILINVLTPWLLLLFLYVWKSSLKAGIRLLIGVVVCVVFVLLEGNRRLVHLPLSHRRKRLYYTSRSVLMIFLMLTLIPAGVYSKYRQQAEQMHLQQFVEEFDVEEREEVVFANFDMPDEVKWKNFSMSEKVSLMECFASDCFQELGIAAVPLWLSEDMEDNSLACFDYKRNVIYLNKNFLNNETLCTQKIAFYLMAHECYHVLQYQVIHSLMILEEAGFDYKGMAYYGEAMQLAEALHSYSEDRKNSQTYNTNALEVGARRYGQEKVSMLAEKYLWN